MMMMLRILEVPDSIIGSEFSYRDSKFSLFSSVSLFKRRNRPLSLASNSKRYNFLHCYIVSSTSVPSVSPHPAVHFVTLSFNTSLGLLLWGGGGGSAQGDPRAMTISVLLFVRIIILITSNSWQIPSEASTREKEETWREIAAEFCLRNIPLILVGFFNMP
jgi:hypothetical protein